MRASTYEQRVHRVMDHIRRNLAEDLSLPVLARVAHFSPYHFHRIFKAATGETVAAFTRRARLERAVDLMRGSPQRPLGSIAVEVGFGAPSDLSRLFRRHYGCSPSAWDRRSRLDEREDFAGAARARGLTGPAPAVRVVEHPARRLAFVRVRDPWRGPHLAEGYRRLVQWLESCGVDWRARTLLGMSWDNDLATPLDQLTYDLGLTIDRDLVPAEPFGVRALPPLRAAAVACRSLPEIAGAWEYLYRRWLPASAYEPDDLPALKRFDGVPAQIDADAWRVECCIPIRARHP